MTGRKTADGQTDIKTSKRRGEAKINIGCETRERQKSHSETDRDRNKPRLCGCVREIERDKRRNETNREYFTGSLTKRQCERKI